MPGWTTTSGQEWPPVAGTRIGAYPYISQLWRAVTERERALGNARWPFAYHAWYEGTVGSITTHADGTHTVTDPDAVGWVASYTCDGVTITAAKRWTGYANRCSPAPSSYDLIIEGNGPDDHEQIVHVQITDNDATTLTTSSALDWVTAGYVPSIASLAGKRYFIIKRGGWWHHERWPQPPNDQERENGTGTGGTVVVAGVTYSTLTDAALAAGAYGRRPWALDQFAGSDLLVYAGGPLRRATIVGNTADTLRFAHQTWTASGPYSVAAAGGRAFPGRYRFGPFAWYGGATDQRLSHLPNDNLGSAPVPAASMRFAESFLKDGECVATARPAFDVDVWSNWQNFCAPGELNYSRWLYATIRGLQAWVEQNAANFIPPVDYDGAPVLPRFNRATLFAHCSINSGASTLAKGTVAGVPDTFYFTVPATYAGVDTEGRPVHWCVQYAPPAGVPNTLWYDGTGPVTGGRVAVTGGADAHLASTVVWSFGWSRRYPRMVHLMFYPRGTAFIPDVEQPPFGDPFPYDPPTTTTDSNNEPDPFGTGTWVDRPGVSTAYIEEDGPAQPFEAGDLARYVGDNFAAANGALGAEPAARYWEHFYVGVRWRADPTRPQDDHQRAWESSMAGTVTAGTAASVTDAGKAWWTANWYHQPSVEPGRPSVPTVRVESGVATGGSGSTLTDSAKATGNPANRPASFYWLPDRFSGFASPWAGFIVEVDQAGVTRKVPITGSDPATGTLQFAAGTVTVAAGDAYRVREPAYHLNQWRGRKVVLTAPDGTAHERKITHNDNDTLWFDPPLPAAAGPGWSYRIVEHQAGGVYAWDGSAWVEPQAYYGAGPGNDPRGATFRDDPTANLPTKAVSFGRVRRCDYVTIDLLTELYDAINAMVWTAGGVAWTSRASPGVAEENYHDAEQFVIHGQEYRSLSDQQAAIQAAWDAPGSPFKTEQGGAAPAAWNAVTETRTPNAADPDPQYLGAARRAYAYGRDAAVPTLIACEVDFYNYSDLTGGRTAGTTATAANEFHDNGDAVGHRVWRRWDTSTPDGDGLAVSDQLGGTAFPAAPPEPPGTPSGVGDDRGGYAGYEVVTARTVRRWDVPGGLEYVSPADT